MTLDNILKEYLASFKDDDYVEQMTPEDLKKEKERIRMLKYEKTIREK